MDETELATASIEDKENRRLHRDVLMAACIDNNFISTTVSFSKPHKKYSNNTSVQVWTKSSLL